MEAAQASVIYMSDDQVSTAAQALAMGKVRLAPAEGEFTADSGGIAITGDALCDARADVSVVGARRRANL